MLGLMGMPRRVYTYERQGLFEDYNLVSTIGTVLMGVELLVFLANATRSWRGGRRVGNDPWRADTFEWYATSPPPPHNFDRVPYASSARPLRYIRLRVARGARVPAAGQVPVVSRELSPAERARGSVDQGDLTRKNLQFGAALFGLTSLLVAGSVIVALAYNALD